MGDRDSDAFYAVELPPLRVRRPRGKRRFRLLTGMSGLLLFACLFMPAIDGCNGAVVPLDAPALWPPYLYGLVFAFAVLARTKRGLVGATIALRTLAIVVMVGGLVYTFVAVPVGAFVIVYGAILLAAIGGSGASERRLAATAIAVASTSSVWFALWSCMPTALLGVKLSLASALGLLVGAMCWMRAVAWPHREPALPPAILADQL